LAFSTLDFLDWLALAGVLTLVLALASAQVQRLPISTSVIYLGLGWAMARGFLVGSAWTSSMRQCGSSG